MFNLGMFSNQSSRTVADHYNDVPFFNIIRIYF